MQKPTKVHSPLSARQSEFSATQKERISALAKAENERAEKRRDSDARIDVNASKWRYICPAE
jgi:hypothetical protein